MPGLSPRQNFLETIRGGSPDRFVNQFEEIQMLPDPITAGIMKMLKPGESCVDGWGVTWSFPSHVPGQFPVIDDEHTVLKDITKWREILKPPRIYYSDEEWKPFIAMADSVDRTQQFVVSMIIPGLFENLHFLMGMEASFVEYYTNPEECHALIE
jgi:hypothetical protein